MKIKLKNCPFCGQNMNKQYKVNREDTIYPISKDFSVWNLVCTEITGGCDASMLGNSIKDVVKKWNRRKS